MNNHDPLSPDERELARLLRRSDVDGGPPAELDTRILAMARQDMPTRSSGKPAAAARPGWGRRRLVSSLAAVASLVLVVGLAWQLRPPTPPPNMQDVSSETSAAAPVSSNPVPAGVEAIPAPPPPAATVPLPTVAPVPRQQQASRPAAAPSRPEPEKDSANPGSPITDTRAAPVMARRAQPPAATPATANAQEPAPHDDAAPPEAAAQLQAAPAAVRAAVPERVPTMPNTPEKMAGKARTATSISSRVATDIEADAALPPTQWLKRIGERRDAGDLEGARASLQRFALDYPKATIPYDLRPLLEE